MGFFSKAKSGGQSNLEIQLRAVNEEVYKHSLELAEKNKTLSLLSKLYEISILALKPVELSTKLCEAIQNAFAFELVGVLLCDEKGDNLKPLAFAQSEHFKTVPTDDGSMFNTSVLLTCPQSDFFKKVVIKRKMLYTENLADICGAEVPEKMFEKIHADGHIRSTLVYPLAVEGNVIGVFILCTNRAYFDLVDYEKESMQDFVNVIAVALDKAFLYEKLAFTNSELSASNERQSKLIHFIGHEVKGFLTKDIAVFSELIEGDYGTLPESAQKLTVAALEQTRDGVRAVTDLLEASDQKKGTVQYHMAPLDFKMLVEEVMEKLRDHVEKKGLQFIFACDPSMQYMITGDHNQLGNHVLRNLIENAINYTPHGTITLSLERNKEKDASIIFTVADTGIGISTDDMSRLFTEGGAGRDAEKINVNSTGYGLFIAKNIVEAHKGTVRAESEGSGKGSCFIVELPAT